jgi:hypothetical protein
MITIEISLTKILKEAKAFNYISRVMSKKRKDVLRKDTKKKKKN